MRDCRLCTAGAAWADALEHVLPDCVRVRVAGHSREEHACNGSTIGRHGACRSSPLPVKFSLRAGLPARH